MPKDKSGKKMTMKEDLAKPPIYAWCNNSGAPSHVYMLKQPNGKLAVYSSVDIKFYALNQTPEQAVEVIVNEWGGNVTNLMIQAHHVTTNHFMQAYPGVHLTYEDAEERVAKLRLFQRLDKLDLRQIRALTRALHPKNVERVMSEREHRKSNYRPRDPSKDTPDTKALKKSKREKEARRALRRERSEPEIGSYLVENTPLVLKKKKKKRA